MDYLTNCTIAEGSTIQKMVDGATEISWETLLSYVTVEEIEAVLPNEYPQLKDDYAVSFFKGIFNSVSCCFIVHSAIEYVFT